jgi:hypothetical protein
MLRKQSEQLDWSGIEFPAATDDNIIRRFEKNNNININLFGYEKDVGVCIPNIYISIDATGCRPIDYIRWRNEALLFDKEL